MEIATTQGCNVQSNQEEYPNDNAPDDAIISVKEHIHQPEKLVKKDVMPNLCCYPILLRAQHAEVIAPLFKTSPTDYVTLYTVLRLTQGISATVVVPQRKTLITLDLDLYSRALKIQQSVGNTNYILRAGALHIAFATLHALGKMVEGSGLDTCAIESGAYTAALRGIFGGKAYKRGLEYHITTSLAIMMMQIDAILSTLPKGPVRVQCITLKEKLHSRNPDMIEVYEDVRSWYSGNVKPREEEKDIGEFAEFLSAYLDQVESLRQFISSCCLADWQSYLASMEDLIKYSSTTLD